MYPSLALETSCLCLELEARILQLPGVLDVSGLTLAGTAANLQLSDTEIPMRGQVDVR